MSPRFTLAFLLLLTSTFATAQEEADSVRRLLRKTSDPAKRADLYSELSWIHYGVYNDSALYYARKMNKEAIKTGDPRIEGNSYRMMGMAYERLSDYPNALKYQQDALPLFSKAKFEEGKAQVYNNIGNIYQHLEDYESALEFQNKALEICVRKDIKPGIAACLGNMGNIFKHMEHTDSARAYYERSLQLDQQMGNLSGASSSLANIGDMYVADGDLDKAREYYERSLEIRRQNNLKEGVANVLCQLGDVALQQDRINDAKEIYDEAVDFARESSAVEALKSAYLGLYMVSKKQGLSERALAYHEDYMRLHDSIFNSTKNEEIGKVRTSFALDQQEERLREIAEKKEREEEKKRLRLRIINIAVIIGLIIIAIFSYFIYNRYRYVQRQRKIIERQKLEVEEKNKQITDSIRYAKTIQQALMPGERHFCERFKEAFLFFAPRDIVSGDFYWMAAQEKDGALCFSIADCTGHGVPGGFMSVLGSSALNEIVNEKGVSDPAEVLNELRSKVTNALGGSDGGEKSKDGMDIAFFRYDPQSGKLAYAGANSQIYVVRNGKAHMYEGDKMPIGFYFVRNDFESQEISLQPGDMVYSFTDGYPDQFGGQSGKKFMYRKLKAMLEKVSGLSAEQQRAEVIQAFEEWKGNEEQVDDVCLMGFRHA